MSNFIIDYINANEELNKIIKDAKEKLNMSKIESDYDSKQYDFARKAYLKCCKKYEAMSFKVKFDYYHRKPKDCKIDCIDFQSLNVIYDFHINKKPEENISVYYRFTTECTEVYIDRYTSHVWSDDSNHDVSVYKIPYSEISD